MDREREREIEKLTRVVDDAEMARQLFDAFQFRSCSFHPFVPPVNLSSMSLSRSLCPRKIDLQNLGWSRFFFFLIRKLRCGSLSSKNLLPLDVAKFLLESVNLSSIDILFTNYRDARALSRVLVNEKSRRGRALFVTTKLGRFLSKLKLHTPG